MNADFYLPQGIVIKKNVNSLVIENPGSIRIGKKQMLLGGASDPRNKNFITLIGPDYRLISGQNKRRKQATEANYIAIRKYLKEHGLSKTNDIAAAIELSPARTRVLLKEMPDVNFEGTNRRYYLVEEMVAVTPYKILAAAEKISKTYEDRQVAFRASAAQRTGRTTR